MPKSEKCLNKTQHHSAQNGTKVNHNSHNITGSTPIPIFPQSNQTELERELETKKKHPKSNKNLKQTKKSKAGSVHEHPQVGWTELESELEKKDNETKSEVTPKPMSTISIPTRDPTTSLTTRATSMKNITPSSSTSTPGKKKTIPPSSTSTSTSPTKKKAPSDTPDTPKPYKTPAPPTSEETKSG